MDCFIAYRIGEQEVNEFNSFALGKPTFVGRRGLLEHYSWVSAPAGTSPAASS